MKSCIFRIVLLFLFDFYCVDAFAQKNKLSMFDSIREMPPFKYYLLDGSEFTPENIIKRRNTVMIYFKNDCPYCNKEASIISDNIRSFYSIQFVFISREDSATINGFAVAHELDNLANVAFVQDKDKTYYNYCTAQYTPSIHVYNNHKKLISYIQGTMKKEQIEKFIK